MAFSERRLMSNLEGAGTATEVDIFWTGWKGRGEGEGERLDEGARDMDVEVESRVAEEGCLG